MKKLLILFAISGLLLSFNSCSKDSESSEKDYSSMIIGKWNHVKTVHFRDGQETGVVEEIPVHVIFYADGICEVSEYYDNKWQMNAQKTYVVNGNILTYYRKNGSTMHKTIRTLTESSLITYYEEYSDSGALLGFVSYYTRMQ